ncbi:hypothetical protein NE237_013366 [Protea cynaroides]|uniref:Uncharacterized protein n=1 Tax=Protea cynaroides TaxID=273540 RepID=A0A9Q0K043_9MAGN|nr:hypothetical protein NE237_013366 [Protea cynaroides]
MVLLFDSDVTKLFNFYESYDRVIQLHVFAVEIDEFPSQDYTVNGFQIGLMTRPSTRQLRRLVGRSRICQKKSPVLINRYASVGRTSASSPGSLKTSSIATITIDGSLRDSGKTNATTIIDSSYQGCSSNSSASADDTSSRHIEKVIPIIDLSNEDEQIRRFESPDREWLDDDEGNIHSSEYNGREYGDDFGVADTEGEGGGVGDIEGEGGGITDTEGDGGGVGDIEGEGGGVADTEGDGGGVGEREDERMEGVVDEVNEIDDVKYDMNYVSDEPLEECEYVVHALSWRLDHKSGRQVRGLSSPVLQTGMPPP